MQIETKGKNKETEAALLCTVILCNLLFLTFLICSLGGCIIVFCSVTSQYNIKTCCLRSIHSFWMSEQHFHPNALHKGQKFAPPKTKRFSKKGRKYILLVKILYFATSMSVWENELQSSMKTAIKCRPDDKTPD